MTAAGDGEDAGAGAGGGEGCTCVIPAFNAAHALPRVIAAVRTSAPGARVVVVDDGSSDGTARVAAERADAVLGWPTNRGKGAALRAGFRNALTAGSASIVTLDADGQHDPALIPMLLEALRGADVAIGARPRAAPMPWRRRVTNRLASAAVTLCTGRSIPDSQCGFRALGASVVEQVAVGGDAARWGDRYEYETAMLIAAARRGWRIAIVPMRAAYDDATVSHFRAWRDTARIARAIARGFVHSV